jgi:putative phosphoesterase
MMHALELFHEHRVDTLIHCGDMTNTETASLLQEFRVIYVYGNCDYASGEIRETLLAANPENFGGPIYQGLLEGMRVAAAHGHQPGLIESWAQSGEFDYIFHGHSHRSRDIQIGKTRIINPGAVGGLHIEDRSVCLLDLPSGASQFLLF